MDFVKNNFGVAYTAHQTPGHTSPVSSQLQQHAHQQITARDGNHSASLSRLSFANNGGTRHPLMSRRNSGRIEDTTTSAIMAVTIRNTALPAGVIARMPDGTNVTLEEKVKLTADGKPKFQEGKFTFDDPKTKFGKGSIEFDANITSQCIDLANIFNNSHKKGALDFVIWYLTKNTEKADFKISGIANDDLYPMCKKNYGMKRDGDDCMTGSFFNVKQIAKQRLLDRGWTFAQ